MKPRSEQGFTLVEVMIALMIFAMLALAGVAILSFSVRAQSATGAKFDGLSELAQTNAVFSADLAQAVDRAPRDEGGVVRPAFIGEADASAVPMLQLVREGWTNIDAVPRASLQKVAYRVAGGALERVAYPMIDGAAPLPAAAVLTDVTSVRLRYRFRGAWIDRWDGSAGIALPQAVELSVGRKDGTVYRQLFLVGTGYAPLPAPPSNSATAPDGTADQTGAAGATS